MSDNPLPDMLNGPELAARLGVHRTTLYRWQQSDVKLRGCIIRETKHSTWFSTARLLERGFLVRPALQVVSLTPSLSFSCQIPVAQ